MTDCSGSVGAVTLGTSGLGAMFPCARPSLRAALAKDPRKNGARSADSLKESIHSNDRPRARPAGIWTHNIIASRYLYLSRLRWI